MGLEPERARLFPLGRIEITPEADALLTPADIRQAIFRHRNGDWGEVHDTRAELILLGLVPESAAYS